MKKLKGGVESIIAVVILAGIVIALIIAVILPMTREVSKEGKEGTDRMSNLTEEMRGTKK